MDTDGIKDFLGDVKVIRFIFFGCVLFLIYLGKQKGSPLLRKYSKWFGTKENHIREQLKRQKKPKPPKTNIWDQWKKLK